MTTKTIVLRGLLLCGMLAVVFLAAACESQPEDRDPLHRKAPVADPSDLNGRILRAVDLP